MTDRRDVTRLWQEQQTEHVAITLDELRGRETAFQAKIRRRNRLEYAASVFVLLVFGFYLWVFPNLLMKAGSVLVMLGTLYVVWQLHKRGAARTPPPEESMLSHLEFHRRELIRQRDAVKSVWRWYIGPFVPGTVLFFAGVCVQAPPGLRSAIIMTLTGAIVAAVFAAIGWLNSRAARRLQQEIDVLQKLQQE